MQACWKGKGNSSYNSACLTWNCRELEVEIRMRDLFRSIAFQQYMIVFASSTSNKIEIALSFLLGISLSADSVKTRSVSRKLIVNRVLNDGAGMVARNATWANKFAYLYVICASSELTIFSKRSIKIYLKKSGCSTKVSITKATGV